MSQLKITKSKPTHIKLFFKKIQQTLIIFTTF